MNSRNNTAVVTSHTDWSRSRKSTIKERKVWLSHAAASTVSCRHFGRWWLTRRRWLTSGWWLTRGVMVDKRVATRGSWSIVDTKKYLRQRSNESGGSDVTEVRTRLSERGSRAVDRTWHHNALISSLAQAWRHTTSDHLIDAWRHRAPGGMLRAR